MKAGVIDTVLSAGGADPLTIFERAKRLGFAGVEVTVRREHLRSGADGRLATLRRAVSATGLQVPSLVLGGHNEQGGLADAEPAVAAAARADVRATLAWAVELGADVVLVPFFLRGELVGEDGFDRCAEAFRELCPEAAALGVALCYEGTLPADGVRLLYERVGSEGFGCYFDLANPLFEGLDTATEVRSLRELIRRVHVKDLRARRGDCQPGLGRVDFAASARALEEVGYDGWLVLETPPAPPEIVGRDLSFTRTVFPSLGVTDEWPRFGAFTHELGAGSDRLPELLRDLGLDTVQLSGELLEQRLDDFGTAPRNVVVTALGGYRNLIVPDRAEREGNLGHLRRCLELAPLLGTSVVSTHAGTRHPTEEWADDPANRGAAAWSLLLEAVETLLPVAERSGSVLALEGSVKSVLRTVGQVVELLDRFPSAHLRLVCDPYNFLSRRLLPAQERATAEFLERFEHRFVLAHVKDVGPEGAEVSTPTVGTGVFEQRPYLEFLRTRRPDLPLVLEHLTPAQIPEARRFVRG